MERSKTIRDILIIFAVSGAVLLWNLGTGSLTSWDEGVYAQVAQEIFKSNNWIDLTFAGVAWSDKPPLCMWVTAVFYKIFGVNEFSARLFSALCAMATVISVYLLGKTLYSRRAAFASALFLLSVQHFIWSAKVGMLDAAFTFFITLSIFLFKLGEERRVYFIFSWIAFAFAFLTKGMGAFLIWLILLPYLIATKKLKILKERMFLLGVLTAVLLLAWWHLLALLHYGKDFIYGYFWKHLVVRTTEAAEGHVGTIFTYFKVIPNKGRPWGAFGFLALLFTIWRVFRKKEKEHILPISWFIVVFLFFSLVKTKLHWYIMPLYPALALLLGFSGSKIFRKFTIPAVAVLVASVLMYLAIDRGVFNLDYAPDAKKTALEVRKVLPQSEKIYLYKILDPSANFYFFAIGRNIKEPADLKKVLQQNNNYILFNTEDFNGLGENNFHIVYKTDSFTACKTRFEKK